MEECVQEMLTDEIIQPISSPWASRIMLAPKKDGGMQFCVDYCKLNSITKKDAYPLPLIQDIFDSFARAKIFSTLDLRSGHWQVPMHRDLVAKTDFTCHLGLFEFLQMPFALTNAPALFQRAMTKVLPGMIGRCCGVFIDDIVIYSKSE